MIGVQLPKKKDTQAVVWRRCQKARQICARTGFASCATMDDCRSHESHSSEEDSRGIRSKLCCVAQTTRRRRETRPGSGYCTPLKDGKGGSEGVSVLSNLSPWIGLWPLVWALLWSTLLLSFGNTGISLYLLSESVPYGGESRTPLY